MKKLKLRQVFTKPVETKLGGFPISDKPGDKKSPTPIGTFFTETIIVKFVEGSDVTIDKGAFVASKSNELVLARAGVNGKQLLKHITRVNNLTLPAKWSVKKGLKSAAEPLFKRPRTALAKEKAAAERISGVEMSTLGLYYALPVPGAGVATMERMINELNALKSVEIAYAAPIPYPARDVGARTDLFNNRQSYLGPASTSPGSVCGIGAEVAWLQPGGMGRAAMGDDASRIRIMDVEQGWQMDHEDLPDYPRFFHDGGGSDNVWLRNHGTAVLGILVADHGSFGMRGIAPEAAPGVMTCNAATRVSGAIYNAIGVLRPGDILLLEVQYPGPSSNLAAALAGSQAGYVPVEYYPAEYDAIRYATARGIIVVEAAGNGSVDLDGGTYAQLSDRARHDSGAIMVGACGMGDRIPADFSNYGTRVDMHAWGDGVATLGYGDLAWAPAGSADASDPRQLYTADFGGTSSASAIVAGAVASVQGAFTARGVPLTPEQMRTLLRETGTPQVPDSRPIGPMPNLAAALAIPSMPVDRPWPSLGGVLRSAPAVGFSNDGRLIACVIGTDGGAWQIAQTAHGSNGPWEARGFRPLAERPPGVGFVGNPAVGKNTDGRLMFFARGSDGSIWHCWQLVPNGEWSSWVSLGPPPADAIAGDPVVARDAQGRLLVFARKGDGGLMIRGQISPGSVWNPAGWEFRGGSFVGNPSVAQLNDGRLEVFARSARGTLQHIWQEGAAGWSTWNTFPGIALMSDPCATQAKRPAPDGRVLVEVYFRTADRQLQAMQHNGSDWEAPRVLPSGPDLHDEARPAVIVQPSGTRTIFARFADNSIRALRDPFGTSAWNSLGGAANTDPVPVVHGDGQVQLFARATDGSLVHLSGSF